MPIGFEQRGEIAIVTLSNGPLNVLTPELHKELFEVLVRVESDDTVKAAVLTGHGSRAFSAGDDIKTIRPQSTPEELLLRYLRPSPAGGGTSQRYPGWEREVLALRRHKPMVGAVRGWCLGQGLIYLCNLTDLRVAGTNARFGLPEIAYGMPGGAAHAGLLDHLPRVLAVKMALTGDPITADEALRAFFVNEVVDDEAVLDRALELATRIARHSQLAIMLEMDAIHQSGMLPTPAARQYAEKLFYLEKLARIASGSEQAPALAAGGRGS